MSRWVALIFWFLLAMSLYGAGKNTDADGLGFVGPVKSVATTTQTFMREPTLPGGPAIIYPLFCPNCEFDRNGNMVRSMTGNQQQRTIRDAQGRIKEQIGENENGEATWREVHTYSPDKMESEDYRDGSLFRRSESTYDDRGNLIESSTYLPDGSLDSYNWNKFDERGNLIEFRAEGPGSLYYDVLQTYDTRAGHLQSTISLNRDGSIRLWSKVNDETVLSYWQQPSDERTYGSDICFSDDNNAVRDCREYKWDGTYLTTHYDFTDSTKRNPLKAVLTGADGDLVLEADYEYEFDRHGNWTRRTVWVRTQESGDRQLLEKDSRTLTYYGAETAPQR
jgi:hypothetical protein